MCVKSSVTTARADFRNVIFHIRDLLQTVLRSGIEYAFNINIYKYSGLDCYLNIAKSTLNRRVYRIMHRQKGALETTDPPQYTRMLSLDSTHKADYMRK